MKLRLPSRLMSAEEMKQELENGAKKSDDQLQLLIKSALALLGEDSKETNDGISDVEDKDIPELVRYDKVVGMKRRADHDDGDSPVIVKRKRGRPPLNKHIKIG